MRSGSHQRRAGVRRRLRGRHGRDELTPAQMGPPENAVACCIAEGQSGDEQAAVEQRLLART